MRWPYENHVDKPMDLLWERWEKLGTISSRTRCAKSYPQKKIFSTKVIHKVDHIFLNIFVYGL